VKQRGVGTAEVARPDSDEAMLLVPVACPADGGPLRFVCTGPSTDRVVSRELVVCDRCGNWWMITHSIRAVKPHESDDIQAEARRHLDALTDRR
jgi:uncharacterized protein YbaR (Trm112 family)